MLKFLSEEWIEALDSLAANSGPLQQAATTQDLVVQQVVSDSPNGTVTWHFAFTPGSVRILSGPALNPNVTFNQDYETAHAIARGELSAQAAFMVGRLRVGGDVGALLSRQESLDQIGDLFAEVRDRTEY